MKTAMISIALTALILSGCATQRFVFDDRANVGRTASKEETQLFFIGGIWQTQESDVAAACNGAKNVGAVEFQLSPFDYVFGYITFGLITTRTAKVYCKK